MQRHAPDGTQPPVAYPRSHTRRISRWSPIFRSATLLRVPISGHQRAGRGYGEVVEAGTEDWHRALTTLVTAGHTVQASGLSSLLNNAVRPLGIDVIVYLADVEQRALRMLPQPGERQRDPLLIEGSLGGRAFRMVTPLVASVTPRRLWMPLVDGTERLGVLDIGLPPRMDPESVVVRANLTAIAGLLAHLVVAKVHYGDTLSRARRSQPMSTGAETLWRLLPPRTFTTDRLVISANLEPCYTVGGDAFDYAVDDDVARVAIFDAVGHGLPAALTATVALGASRSARVQGQHLRDIARAVDQAILGEFPDCRFVTAVMTELDLHTGVLRYFNAGHPPPVLIRNGKAVAMLDKGRRVPLGLDEATADIAELSLEPEDRLLFYTDGFTEARDERDEQFGLERLIDFAERHAAAGLPPPETLRRLTHDLVDYQHGPLRDDASLLLLSWKLLSDEEQTLP